MGIELPILEHPLKTGRTIHSVPLETLEKMPGTTAVSANVGSNSPVTPTLQGTVTCVRSLRVPERNVTLV